MDGFPRTIVVIGASGNVGTGVLRRLAVAAPGTRVIGVCRRPPQPGPPFPGVEWHALDLTRPEAVADLVPLLRGADAVVHLAWAIQPVRREAVLRRTNVDGTRAVLRAVQEAGTPHLVYASTLGVYAPGAPDPVDEAWPDSGRRTSVYSRHKVEVERILDRFEQERPEVAVTRIRPTLVVQRHAATEIRGLFLGPLVPRAALELLRRHLLPVLPLPSGLALQFVHADDVGDAVVRTLRHKPRGVFNLAADRLDVTGLAATVGARAVTVPSAAVRALLGALFAVRAVPVSPGWYDVAADSPIMDTGRARAELGWVPAHTSAEAARELLGGLADGAVGATPALGG